jgi:hypothetical protein
MIVGLRGVSSTVIYKSFRIFGETYRVGYNLGKKGKGDDPIPVQR